MILTRAEIADLVRDYGCPEAQVPTAVAVCLAESGGKTDAVYVNTGGTAPGSVDRGLFQINDHWHPEVSDACAFDPDCAADAAYRISKQWTDFSPWNAYKSGAYLKHLETSMEIIRRTTLYYTPAAHPRPPLGIVLHNTVTRTLVAPHNQGSWHYEIDRDGTVYQYVKDEDYAWHVRTCDEWKPDWVRQRSGTVSEMNSCSIGIELVSFMGGNPEPGYEPYTAAQYQATRDLLAHLYAKYGTLPIVSHGSVQLDRTDPVGFVYARAGLVWRTNGYRYEPQGEEDMATIAELQAQIDQLNGVNTELNNQVSALRAEVDGLNGVNTDLQGQLDYCQQLKQEVEAGLTAQVQQLNQIIAELEAREPAVLERIQVVKEYPVASRVVVVFPDGTEHTLPSAP